MTAPATPTTREIKDNIVAQISASIGQNRPGLPKAFTNVLARALSGLYVILYKLGGFVFLQMFVRTASDKPVTFNGQTVTPLREWGRLVGIPDPTEAEQAELQVTVTVISKSAANILPTGSQLIGAGNGVTYVTVGAVVLNLDTVQVPVRAVGDQQGGDGSGTIGNLSDGSVLSFANPLPFVTREVVVDTTLVTGADEESTEDYRNRVFSRFQQRPQGGAPADYKQWGEEAAGVRTVYPYTGIIAGQVDLYVESATETDGIPTTAQLQAVLAAVTVDENGLASRRPIGALPNTYPITRTAFEVSIEGLSVPGDLGAARDQIDAAVEAYFLEREPFIVGLNVGSRTDRVTATGVGGVVQTIVDANQGFFTDFVLSLGGTPVTVYVLSEGEKAKGTTSYV